MSTNLMSQVTNMNSHGVPNDMLPTFNGVAAVIFLSICQHLVNPALHRMKLPFAPVNRMTVGFIVEAMAMAYVVDIQKLIYSIGPCFNRPRRCAASLNSEISNQLHVLIQILVFILKCIGETYSNPAGFEYAYPKAPVSIKTVVQAAFALSSAGGS